MGLLLLLWAPGVFALEEPRKYVTLALSHGRANVDVDAYDAVDVLTFDAEYHATPTIGLALGARKFDDFSTRGVSSGSLSLEGYEIALVANTRLWERLVVQGRAGYMHYELAARALGRKVGEENDETPTLGFGVQYELNEWVGLHADARRAFTVSDATVDWITAGVFVRLGPRLRKKI